MLTRVAVKSLGNCDKSDTPRCIWFSANTIKLYTYVGNRQARSFVLRHRFGIPFCGIKIGEGESVLIIFFFKVLCVPERKKRSTAKQSVLLSL